MKETQRKLVLITSLGKKYSGMVDIPNDSFRTTDLFNSKHIYWKNPKIKCHDNAICMNDTRLFVDEKAVYKRFSSMQIKLSEIIYLYDDLEYLGNETEKLRASTMMEKTRENAQRINIITCQVANSFYDIAGIFYGSMRKKSKDAFIPLIQATITEVFKKEEKWFRREVVLPHNFVCISSNYIESMTLN